MISLSSPHPPPLPLSLPPPVPQKQQMVRNQLQQVGTFFVCDNVISVHLCACACVHEIERWKDEACLTFLIRAQPLYLHYDAQ